MTEMLHLEMPGGAIYAPDWQAVASLNKKIARLMGNVGTLKKDAVNTFHNYRYVSYEQVGAVVRAAMSELGLSFTFGIANADRTTAQTKNGTATNAVLELEVCIADGDTGAMRIMRWLGEGQDAQDKATAKALTSGIKYGLMRCLLASDQDSPDADADEDDHGTRPPSQAEPVTKSAAKPVTQPGPSPVLNVQINTHTDADRDNTRPEPDRPHWIKDSNVRARFWAWTNELGLTNAEVHAALGVEHVEQFAGGMADAKRAIEQWVVKQQSEPEPAPTAGGS